MYRLSKKVNKGRNIKMNENTNNEYEEISIIEIISILLKGKVIIIIMLCIGLFGGLGYSLYQNSKAIPVSTSTIELVSSINAKINEEKSKLVFNDQSVKAGAVEILQLDENTSLGSIRFLSKKNNLFSISVANKDSEFANEVNYALIESYQQALDEDYQFRYGQAESNVLASIESMESSLGDMESESNDAVIAEAVAIVAHKTDMVYINVVGPPSVSMQGKASLTKNIAIGIIMGLFLGFVLVFLREWWSNNKKLLKSD